MCPVNEEPPPYEVLAALVASLRRELAEAVAALEQAGRSWRRPGSGSLSWRPG